MTTAEIAPPIAPFVQRDDSGTPFIAGSKCTSCGHVYIGERSVCANCTARDQMEPVHVAETGKLYVYTIVHRSFPGVKTPFVDVIVDMDDGSHLKGTLHGVEPDEAKIPFDLPVQLVFREETPINKPDTAYLTYAFEPLNA